jgi:hypothetical protein
MAGPRTITREGAESLAIQSLTFLAGDPERLGRFLALSGIGPERIRIAAAEPGFLAGVLDHLMADEALLRAFADAARIDPADVAGARQALSGPAWERGET